MMKNANSMFHYEKYEYIHEKPENVIRTGRRYSL